MSFHGLAQTEIDNYKYILVADRFQCQKEANQYRLNELTEFLFNKYGYKAYLLGKDLPLELAKNKCLALTADVSNDKSGLLKTKLIIELKDCYGKLIMTSQIGESRAKEYKTAYNLALRDAFNTFIDIDYKYNSKDLEPEPEIEEKSLDDEATNIALDTSLRIHEEKDKKDNILVSEVNSNFVYYAQAIKNGFQVVDSESKIIMVLLTTSAFNVFIVKDKNAIVFKEDGFWYYSENDGELSEKKQLNIKF
jgi:hypothetical protein